MNIFSRILRSLLFGSKPASSRSRPEIRSTAHSRTQIAERAPSGPTTSRARGERTLIIGVDFGTNSTKVIWQDLSSNSFEVFQWLPQVSGVTSMLFPTTVTVRNGALHFGVAALNSGSEFESGSLLRSRFVGLLGGPAVALAAHREVIPVILRLVLSE